MIVLPIVPVPRFLLLSGIHFFLLAVCILLVLLSKLLLPLSSFLQVLHLEVSHLLKSHRGLVAVGSPNLADQLFALVLEAAVMALWMMGRQEELLLKFLRFLYTNYFHRRYGFILLSLVSFLCLLIMVQTLSVLKHFLFLNN